MTKNNLLRPSVLVLAAALMSVGLAGCDQKKNVPAQATNEPALPLTAGPATAIVAAPAASALPSAPRVRVVHIANQSDGYAYVDRAYEMSSAIGQAPPDYGFDYEGVHPWVWRSSNREVRLVEPVEGGYRYYYYRPGADEPYLVRDPSYSYGFSDGQLVTVYDNEGRLLPPDYIDQRADDAGRYLARATALYQASLQSERRSVNAANWAARRAALDAERSRWEAQQNQQDAWRSYHAQHEAEDQAYWRGEHDQRDRSARSFNDWQSRGYNGPPPPPVDYAGHDNRNDQSLPGQGQSSPRGNGPGDHGQSALPPIGPAPQGDAAQQAQQQRTQADAVRVQQMAQADAAQQAQAKAAADASANAARVQQKAQADAAQQAQVKAAADASANAARAQHKAQADAAQQAQAKADAARRAQTKAAPVAPAILQAPKPSQPLPTAAQPTKEQIAAQRAAAKKAYDDAHPHDDTAGKPPAQQ